MTTSLISMERHELSALFARHDMKNKAFKELVEDIKATGLLNPITTLDGKVLDGWNRYQACLEAGVEPQCHPLPPGQDPWKFVRGANMLRRHMTARERAAIFVLKAQLEGVACSKLNTPTVREIQQEAEVSIGTAQKAQAIARAGDPELTRALVDDRVSMEEAVVLAKLPEEERHIALDQPQTKQVPKGRKNREDRVGELEGLVQERDEEIADLRARLAEMDQMLKAAQGEIESRDRILDAEDLLAAYKAEVSQNLDLVRVTKSRNDELMEENDDLKRRLRGALRTIDRLEKGASESRNSGSPGAAHEGAE